MRKDIYGVFDHHVTFTFYHQISCPFSLHLILFAELLYRPSLVQQQYFFSTLIAPPPQFSTTDQKLLTGRKIHVFFLFGQI